MLYQILALLPYICWAEPSLGQSARGYPLFFGSFGEVGDSVVRHEITPIKEADSFLTKWTKGCPADAFILIKDSTPFQLSGLKMLQRLGENSLTRGTFLTDFMVNLREFALDLEDYCEANYIEVDNNDLDALPQLIDTRPRVYYAEFDKDSTAESKNEILEAILGRTSSPFVTIVYTSTFMQSQPMLRNLKTNSKRGSWESSKLKHNRKHIAPIIAPLFNNVQSGHSAPEPQIELPDHFFLTLLFASVLGVGMLVYRDLKRAWQRPSKLPSEKTKQS